MKNEKELTRLFLYDVKSIANAMEDELAYLINLANNICAADNIEDGLIGCGVIQEQLNTLKQTFFRYSNNLPQ